LTVSPIEMKKEEGRPIKTLEEAVKRDLMLNNIPQTLVFNWAEWWHV